MFNNPEKRKMIKCPDCGKERYYYEGNTFRCRYCGEYFDKKGKAVSVRIV